VPFLKGLDFATAGRLSVAYVATDKPQVLRVEMTTDALPQVGLAPLGIGVLARIINLGGGGGGEFAPAAGSAKVLSGPRGGTPEAVATRYSWDLEVAGMSPLFVRTIVERLRVAGGCYVTSMSIVGSLPLDGGPYCVTDREVRAWLDDANAYPGTWHSPGFPIVERSIMRGAAMKLAMGGDLDHDVLLRFHDTVSIWNLAIENTLSPSHDGQGAGDATPRVVRSQTELCARYDVFEFDRVPAKATLINMLSRFHSEVAPIEEAEIAIGMAD